MLAVEALYTIVNFFLTFCRALIHFFYHVGFGAQHRVLNLRFNPNKLTGGAFEVTFIWQFTLYSRRLHFVLVVEI